MKPTKIYQEFEQLAESLEVKIIQEKGNFKGGYFLLEKEKIINRFFESLTLIQELLGPFPFPKFDLVFCQYEFESNSILFIDPENLSSELESLPAKIFNQYFY